MKTTDWKRIGLQLKKYVLNKYVITCCFFAIMLTFCGEHNLINRVQHARQIHAMKAELEEYQKQTEQRRKDIRAIQGKPDQIERFARERYYMHADNETVFVIEEDE